MICIPDVMQEASCMRSEGARQEGLVFSWLAVLGFVPCLHVD